MREGLLITRERSLLKWNALRSLCFFLFLQETAANQLFTDCTLSFIQYQLFYLIKLNALCQIKLAPATVECTLSWAVITSVKSKCFLETYTSGNLISETELSYYSDRVRRPSFVVGHLSFMVCL